MEEKKKSNGMYFLKMDMDMWGGSWYLLIQASDIEEAKEKARHEFLEVYLADEERLAENDVDPNKSEIELNKNGVSKPIWIERVE